MRRSRLRPLAAAAAGLAALAALAPGSAAPSEGAVLTGVVRVGSFALPRGQTRVVVGALRLLARRDILIAGTLLLAPEARLELSAGQRLVVASGARIVPGPSETTRGLLAAAGQPALSQLGSTDEYIGGTSAVIDGAITAEPGRSVEVSTHGSGVVTVDGSIMLPPGAGSSSPGAPGEDGGSITIGASARRVVIGQHADLRAGAGGNGYTDTHGTRSGEENPCHNSGGWSGARGELRLQASDGGSGGAIHIWTSPSLGDASSGTASISEGSYLRPGDGGNGGDVKARQARSGAPGHAGTWLVAYSGSGGAGGAMTIDATFPSGPRSGAVYDGVYGYKETRIDGRLTYLYDGLTLRSGRGGDAGSILAAAAGDGAPGCDGGQTAVKLGKPGPDGPVHGPSDSVAPPTALPLSLQGLGSITLFAGGNGGRGPDAKQPGGAGGGVQIGTPLTRVKSISLSLYGNGGPGFDGCPAPPTDGTDGGAGGRLSINNPVPYDAFLSFNGGDGGDGDGLPADGGPPGKANRASAGHTASSFERGRDGNPCKPTVAVATEVSSPEPPSCAVAFTWTVSFGTDAASYDGETVALALSGPGAPSSATATVSGGRAVISRSEPAADWGAAPAGPTCAGGSSGKWWRARIERVGGTVFAPSGSETGAQTSTNTLTIGTKVGPPTISGG